MGRWAVAFFMLFVTFNFLASIGEGGGGIAVTRLNGALSSSATTITVDNTVDFLDASVAHPAYLQIDKEIMTYTGKTASTFTGITRAVADPQNSYRGEATQHKTRTHVKTLAVSSMDTFMGYNVSTSNASWGSLDSATFAWHLFTNLPKYLTWNYSFLQGQLIYAKYFLMFTLSAGFVFSIAFGLVSLAWGIFNK